MFCEKCGNSILSEAKFCDKCGTPISNGEIILHENQKEDLPFELRKWNWGAALLGWIWAIGNKAYLMAILGIIIMFIPFVGWLVSIILFGIKGNEWAWESKGWNSVEHFRRVQKIWRNWAIGITLVILFLTVLFTILPLLSSTTENDKTTSVSDKSNINTSIEEEAEIDPVTQADYQEGYKSGYVDGRGSQGQLGDNYAEPATEERKDAYLVGYLEGFLKGCREGNFDCSAVENAINDLEEDTSNTVNLIPPSVN